MNRCNHPPYLEPPPTFWTLLEKICFNSVSFWKFFIIFDQCLFFLSARIWIESNGSLPLARLWVVWIPVLVEEDDVYIIAGLAWSLKNTPGDLCNCKKWGHLYMDYLVGVMSDTSSFFKGVSEFRGILTLWPQVFNIFNVAHVRSLPTSKIAFRKIGYLLKSLGHSAKKLGNHKFLMAVTPCWKICRLKTCEFPPKKHLTMELHPSVADDRNPFLIKPPGRTSTENSTRNAIGEVAWVEWWFLLGATAPKN